MEQGGEDLAFAIRDGKLTDQTLGTNQQLSQSLQHSLGPVQPQAK